MDKARFPSFRLRTLFALLLVLQASSAVAGPEDNAFDCLLEVGYAQQDCSVAGNTCKQQCHSAPTIPAYEACIESDRRGWHPGRPTPDDRVVEVHPSANRIIGPMADYGEHHVFRLTLDEDNRLSRQVRVSVNSEASTREAKQQAFWQWYRGLLLPKGRARESDAIVRRLVDRIDQLRAELAQRCSENEVENR